MTETSPMFRFDGLSAHILDLGDGRIVRLFRYDGEWYYNVNDGHRHRCGDTQTLERAKHFVRMEMRTS